MRLLLSVVIAAAALQGQISSGEIVKRAAPAVVAIRTSSPAGESSASGFIVDPSGTIVTNLHVVEGVTAVAVKARDAYGIGTVVLVGGVFLNGSLVSLARASLLEKGFTVLRPERYSPNDESISIGQAAHALARLAL